MKEFAVVCAQNAVWAFAHLHRRWLVKNPSSHAQGGPKYLLGIRHFGDTHVEHTPISDSIEEYLERCFASCHGDLVALARSYSMCEFIYFVLLCLHHQLQTHLSQLPTEAVWKEDS